MQRLDLVKFLADEASELIAREIEGGNAYSAGLDEAAELLNLSSRIMARTSTMVGKDLIHQEAA
ncbi:MAG: hypothetical protein JJ900_08590 [Rhodospirillales bacterium]|nr:hypothetical protein [Rhodospirillales bacterium]MBO6786895.1 hypothetical protein [Rhodospirillales bacterium]